MQALPLNLRKAPHDEFSNTLLTTMPVNEMYSWVEAQPLLGDFSTEAANGGWPTTHKVIEWTLIHGHFS